MFPTDPSPWPALEQLPALSAVTATWRRLLGVDYPAFSRAFLQPRSETATRYPCERCACFHEVVVSTPQPAASVAADLAALSGPPPAAAGPPPLITAYCRCEPLACAPFQLEPEDIVVWELSWSRLGRALCQALGLSYKAALFGLGHTRQIGTWSAEPVPVILTIQSRAAGFRHALAELGLRLQRPFILLAPTHQYLDAAAAELLAHAKAGCFDLASRVRLTAQGTLHAARTPGELFAPFTAQPAVSFDEDTARRAFALVQQLHSEESRKPPTVLTVFRLYCLEEMSAARIAGQCGCSKSVVLERLSRIRTRTGMEPERLRRLSSHLDKIQAETTDSRAVHIHPRRLIYDEESEEC